jgi:hypothetical protein
MYIASRLIIQPNMRRCYCSRDITITIAAVTIFNPVALRDEGAAPVCETAKVPCGMPLPKIAVTSVDDEVAVILFGFEVVNAALLLMLNSPGTDAGSASAVVALPELREGCVVSPRTIELPL